MAARAAPIPNGVAGGYTVGSRIRAARDKLNMTQQELAGPLEVSRAAISQWEADITSPTVDKATALAKALNVAEEWLAFGRSVDADRMASTGMDNLREVSWGDKMTQIVQTGSWNCPRRWLKNELRLASPEKAVIWEVNSDSLSPLYEQGDRAIVDTEVKRPGNGYYLLWLDGVGPVLNKISVGPQKGSINTIVATVSDTDGAYEVPVSDVKVLGKIRGAWKRAQ